MIRPPLIRATFLVVLASAIVVFPVTGESQGNEKGEKPKKGGKNKADTERVEEAVQSALPSELTSHFPIGREFKGVAIPSYTEDVLKSVLRADSVIRVDEQFLDLINLKVQVYNSAGEPETTISMDEATYDLIIGELASKTPSRIEQPRFTMTGDKMIYQTDSQVARMIGNVKLIVPDAGQIAPDFGIPAGKQPGKSTP